MSEANDDETAPAAPHLPAGRLIVLGSVHLDVLLRLPRLPLANDRLMPLEVLRAPGGMGGNVAATFARLGGSVCYIGRFSDSDDGRFLRADLEHDGVDTSFATVDPDLAPGNQGLLLVGEDGARAMLGVLRLLLDAPRISGQGYGQHAAAGQLRLREQWRRRLHEPWQPPDGLFDAPACGLYCPGNFAPALLPALPDTLSLFTDIEVHHTGDWTEDTLRTVLGRATVVFGNAASLAGVSGQLGLRRADELAPLVDGLLVITLGAAGCLLVRGIRAWHMPGFAVASIDTTGAGDCFAAAFILALLRTQSPIESAAFANAAAALSTRSLGSRTSVPTADELRDWLASHSPAEARVVPATAALLDTLLTAT